MECPFCTAILPEEDQFCEECGKPLQAAAPQLTGCTCGAPAEEIDEDGYCGRCGRLARRPASDHVETIVSADFAGVSDRGLKHSRNEDRFDIRQVGDSYVLVVCDGVSGSTQSETASSFVARHVADLLEASLLRHSASSPERTVRSAILDAQARLAGDAPPGDPSTTVVAALVRGAEAAIGWAGDSRAYWIGPEKTCQLTVDHSWINDVVASGTMSPDEAAKAPQAHGITRWIGADAGENANPDVVHFEIAGPGCLLMCTDGLWNYSEKPVPDGNDAVDIARGFVDFANQQGGHDNITAVVLRLTPGRNGTTSAQETEHL